MNNIQAEVNPILFERVVNNKAEIELPKANDIPTFANFIVPSRCPKTSDGIKAGAPIAATDKALDWLNKFADADVKSGKMTADEAAKWLEY